jgi:hypothetical protein
VSDHPEKVDLTVVVAEEIVLVVTAVVATVDTAADVFN